MNKSYILSELKLVAYEEVMGVLSTDLQNCYGIKSLVRKFDFTRKSGSKNAFLIYAPNGLMKTSFTRTFEALAKGQEPIEERFGRTSKVDVNFKGVDLEKEKIYVLKSEIDLNSDEQSVTNLLINKSSKKKYDNLLSDLNESKLKLLNELKELSGIPLKKIEGLILKDFGRKDLIISVNDAIKIAVTDDLSIFKYGEIFDPKAEEVLNSDEFTLKARDFAARYDEIFSECGGLYKKGIFNPTKANNTSSALEKNSFFDAGHKVKIDGENEAIGLEDYKKKIIEVNKKIDEDKQLSSLKKKLEKNIQAQAIQNLLEKSDSSQIEMFITKANRNRRELFKKEIWSYYLSQCSETSNYLEKFESHKTELEKLEIEAAKEAPNWLNAINLFNSRFVDMPFKLDLYNQSDVVLGRDKAVLKFIFEEGSDIKECKRTEIKALSQGEKRALYLLNFIFDVENRKRNNQETIFVIDDIADSFDYKNKHAILQYLEDLTRTEFFYQIILTHNFDFFRSLANNFVHRERCLMANKIDDSIELVKADAVNDIFLNLWKGRVHKDDGILYSCVPFSRNIVEYTKGCKSEEYELLTKLLHWKKETQTITKGEFFKVYNSIFGTSHEETSKELMFDLLMNKSESIISSNEVKGIDLQDKILLSIATRILGEMYITNQLRICKSDNEYWSSNGQFGKMLNELEGYFSPTDDRIVSLRKVSVTVSSNIHLNSFMYEPILDLSLIHLIELYKEIKSL